MLPFDLLLSPLLCQNFFLLLMRLNPTTNKDSLIWHWRSGGLLSVVDAVMYTSCYGNDYYQLLDFFRYGVNRYHRDRLIGIRELSERLAQDCFKNPFSPDRGTPTKIIPPLDEVDDGDTVSSCRAINFSSCISPYTLSITIYGTNLNSASSISIGSHNISKK